jgi:hypothetical protein
MPWFLAVNDTACKLAMDESGVDTVTAALFTNRAQIVGKQEVMSRLRVILA